MSCEPLFLLIAEGCDLTYCLDCSLLQKNPTAEECKKCGEPSKEQAPAKNHMNVVAEAQRTILEPQMCSCGAEMALEDLKW